MPSMCCAVATCKNWGNKVKGLSYHRFPKKDPLLKSWVEKCRRKDVFNPEVSRICSEHFKEDDFVNDLRSKLLGMPKRKQLKPDVIPTQKLHLTRNVKQSKRKKLDKDVENILDVAADASDLEASDELTSNIMDKNKINALVAENERLIKEKINKDIVEDCLNAALVRDNKTIKELQAENTRLIEENEHYKKKLLTLNAVMKEQKLLKKKNAEMRKQLLELKRNRLKSVQTGKKYAENLLSKIFTPGQIKALMNSRRVKWNTVDMCSAIALRTVSHKAYSYLKNVMKIPLPGLSTIKEWRKKIDVSPGIQSDLLQLMNTNQGKLTEKEKL